MKISLPALFRVNLNPLLEPVTPDILVDAELFFISIVADVPFLMSTGYRTPTVSGLVDTNTLSTSEAIDALPSVTFLYGVVTFVV